MGASFALFSGVNLGKGTFCCIFPSGYPQQTDEGFGRWRGAAAEVCGEERVYSGEIISCTYQPPRGKKSLVKR